MTEEQKLLDRAAEEIVRLRKFNREMNIKLEMFDKMMMLAGMQPPREGGLHSPESDIVKDIDENLNENLDKLSADVRRRVAKR